ncbi:MAG: type 4a pilus biogenesis protein PilO [Candidatus Doudnabacteria bacterium]|nr:type 4a pilus biogenesis protein PilO [Candidatus Doudnabacteria bacterium]
MTAGSSAKTYSLMAAVLVVGCLIVTYMVLSNVYPAYTLAQGQLTNVKADNARYKQALASSVAFLATYEQQNKNQSTVNLSLPEKNADMADFVSSFSQIATQSGVTLTNLAVTTQPLETTVENAIRAEDLTLNASGSYLSFKDFVKRMEEHLRVVDVYHITFSNAGAVGSGTPILHYLVKLRTYYQQ